MFYQKYRPSSFAEIIKPNIEVETIQRQLVSGSFPHAYILSGSKGIGKTSTARIIAKAVNCLDFKGDICDKCENCLAFKNGSFIDVVEIDGASNRRIEDIRDLREGMVYKPLKGVKKVYIIDEVHMLTNEAFNALLKSLEEPPEHVMFILCTTEVHKIPETIRSRCQLFTLKKPTDKQIVEKLQKIALNEGLKYDLEQLESIALQSGGAFRDAETLLTQYKDNPEYIENLGNYKSKQEFFSKFFEKNSSYISSFILDIEGKGQNITNWLQSYISFVRSLLHMKIGIRTNIYQEILSQIETSYIINHLNVLIEIYSKIRYSQNPELLLEILLLKTIYPETISKEIEKNRVEVVKVYSPKTPAPKIENIKIAEPKAQINHSDVLTQENSNEEIEEDLKIPEESILNSSDFIDNIKNQWAEVVKASGSENKTLESLLKVIRPVALINDVIIFEVDFKFHAERLDNNKNKLQIEKILYSFFNRKLLYKTVIKNTRTTNGFNGEGKQNLTDYNVGTPKDLSADDVLAIFDGAVGVK
jgi:DNA polymerase-3 subunit gamma/tau